MQLRQPVLVYRASWIFANENISCAMLHRPAHLNGTQWISMDLSGSQGISMVYPGIVVRVTSGESNVKRRSLRVQWFRMVSTRLAQNGPSVPHTLQLPLL